MYKKRIVKKYTFFALSALLLISPLCAMQPEKSTCVFERDDIADQEIRALDIAIHQGNVGEVCAIAARNNISPHYEINWRASILYATGKATLLARAVDRSHQALVCALLERKGDPNAPTGYDNTLLGRAAVLGNLEIVTLLLTHKADPNANSCASDVDKQAPEKVLPCLHQAAATSAHFQRNIIELLTKTVDINSLSVHKKTTALYQAIKNQRPSEQVQFLLELGADPTIPDSNGTSPLELLIQKRDIPYYPYLATGADQRKKVAMLLCIYGADIAYAATYLSREERTFVEKEKAAFEKKRDREQELCKKEIAHVIPLPPLVILIFSYARNIRPPKYIVREKQGSNCEML